MSAHSSQFVSFLVFCDENFAKLSRPEFWLKTFRIFSVAQQKGGPKRAAMRVQVAEESVRFLLARGCA